MEHEIGIVQRFCRISKGDYIDPIESKIVSFFGGIVWFKQNPNSPPVWALESVSQKLQASAKQSLARKPSQLHGFCAIRRG